MKYFRKSKAGSLRDQRATKPRKILSKILFHAYVPDFWPHFIQMSIFEPQNWESMSTMKNHPMVIVAYAKKFYKILLNL